MTSGVEIAVKECKSLPPSKPCAPRQLARLREKSGRWAAHFELAPNESR